MIQKSKLPLPYLRFIVLALLVCSQLALGSNINQSLQKHKIGIFQYYKKEALRGNISAQLFLARMYIQEKGILESETKAIKWLRKAANKEAFEELQKIAQQGNAEAQCNLGVMYEYGEGVSKNYKQAVEWYQKTADQGYKLSLNKYLNMLLFSVSISYDKNFFFSNAF